MNPPPPDDLEVALGLADAADVLTMAAFTGSRLAFTTKADGSPVTDTDRAVEDALVDLVRTHRPHDGFLGEEAGPRVGVDDRCWVVDPIDGTRSFVTGGRNWGTQIALEVGGTFVVGVTSAPAAGARWWGEVGAGAFRRIGRDGPAETMATSAVRELAAARWICHPDPDGLAGTARVRADRLAAVAGVRPRPTSHGALMVAEGSAELCLALDGAAWDHAAFAAIVTAAGGRFSYLDASTHPGGMRAALYSNGPVHEAALVAIGG